MSIRFLDKGKSPNLTPANIKAGVNIEGTIGALADINSDPDFVVGNIKQGIEIVGKIGTLVDVNADTDFIPANIKQGVNIAGKVGTLVDVVADTDFNASNIKLGVNVAGTVGTFSPLSAGNTAIYAGTSTQTTSNTAIELVYQYITTANSGTVRVKFGLEASFDGNVYGQIYVNGVARGVQRTKYGQGVTTYTEDISVNNEDRISIYCWRTGTLICYISNIAISISAPTFHS
jgi:hypothetical protein